MFVVKFAVKACITKGQELELSLSLSLSLSFHVCYARPTFCSLSLAARFLPSYSEFRQAVYFLA